MGFKEQLEMNKIPAVKVIAEYLMTRPDLKEKLENPKKSLEEMFKYIVSKAKKLAEDNCAFVNDEEVCGWAVHYYDEENINFKPVKGKVKVATNMKPKGSLAIEKKKEKVKETQERLEKEQKEREEKKLKTIMETPNIVLNPKKKKETIVEGQISLFEVL